MKNSVNKDYLQRLLYKFSKSANVAAAVYDFTGGQITETNNQFYKETLSLASVKLFKILTKTHRPAKVEVAIKNIIEAEDSIIVCKGVPILSDNRFFGAIVFVQNDSNTGIDTLAEFFADSVAELYDFASANNALINEKNELAYQNENLFNKLETMKVFIDTANVAIYVIDYNTREIIMWNNKYAEHLGRKGEDLSGKICWKLIGRAEICPSCKRNMIIDNEGNILPECSREIYIHPPFDIWLRITDKALVWEDGRLVHTVTLMDVSEHYVLEDKLNKLAYYECNLEMPNSLALEENIKSHVEKSHLLLIDIEGMRKINNVYGRNFGDLLLKEVRNYLYSLDIPKEFIYRLAVADFGILLSYSEEKPDALSHLASLIYNRCNYVWNILQNGVTNEIFISVNICIVPVNTNSGNFLDLINNMEQTLDIARKSSAITTYNKDVSEHLHNRLRLELSLNSDIKDNMRGFYINYQPIINARIAMWCGLEALCRWNSSELGTTPPSVFIPLAENTGQIRAIGEWIIENSIIDVKKLGLHNYERFFLNINLSPVQLSSDNIDKIIVQILEKHEYPPEKLGLEITESKELNFSKHTLKAMERLSEIGVIITMDDFGSGYSSFNTLNRTPAKVLKTSRSFVYGMESDMYLQNLFRVIVELAHVSEMKLIATGVETKSQAIFLLNQGIDLFQGYYFSYPLTIEEVKAKIDKFYTPSGEIVSMGYSRLDITRLRDIEAGYFLTPKLHKLLAKSMQILFNGQDSDEAINITLQQIGEGLNVSRSYVFLVNSDGMYSNSHEWCAKGILSEKDNLQNIEIPHTWLDKLICDGIIIASDISVFDTEIYEFLKMQGIKAIVEFPIWRDNRLYGFVGFDDCVSYNNWTAGEVQMLYNLTGIIASVLYKIQLQNKVVEQGKVLENVLNNMNKFIYVTDLETNEILFANSKLINKYGVPLKGKICWEVLQNRSERCDFCPLQYMENKLGETYEWEYYNKKLRRYFKISDSIIQWSGDKLAHLEYAEDITDIKDYQFMLELYASTDMFTRTLNRTSFINNVVAMLQIANDNNLLITLAFIDIDGLKNENDTYGHDAGDKFISNVVYSINSNIRESDKVGRYGGDEFIVAFYKCPKEIARKRMEEALCLLDKISRKEVGRTLSFSYGLVENIEIPYTEDNEYIESLISIADSRMFTQKNAKKLRHNNTDTV